MMGGDCGEMDVGRGQWGKGSSGKGTVGKGMLEGLGGGGGVTYKLKLIIIEAKERTLQNLGVSGMTPQLCMNPQHNVAFLSPLHTLLCPKP